MVKPLPRPRIPQNSSHYVDMVKIPLKFQDPVVTRISTKMVKFLQKFLDPDPDDQPSLLVTTVSNDISMVQYCEKDRISNFWAKLLKKRRIKQSLLGGVTNTQRLK